MLGGVGWWSVIDSRDRLLKPGPIGCPEASVTDHQLTSHNIPEEQRPRLHGGVNLKYGTIQVFEFTINCSLHRYNNRSHTPRIAHNWYKSIHHSNMWTLRHVSVINHDLLEDIIYQMVYQITTSNLHTRTVLKYNVKTT